MDGNEKYVAYCGIVCTDCPAYIATQSGERSELQRVAERWEKEYHLETVTIEDVTCDGCLGQEGCKGSHCHECEIRACALALNVENCAHCEDYSCEKLDNFFGFAPDARVLLDQIHASL
jgi:hypothetical protein